MDVSQVINDIGLTKIAQACSVTPAAVHRWKTRNRLPRTEWTGETAYAERIAELHGGVSAHELLSTCATTPVQP